MTPGTSLHGVGDYALLADGTRGALIGPRGDIAWMCFPQWHGPAVFAGLIGSGGVFSVEPVEPYVSSGFYEDGTLIWRSRWVTQHGIVESRDALALPASEHRAVILRRIVAIRGPADVQVKLHPAVDYGKSTAGRWTGRGGGRRWSSAAREQTWRVSGVRNGAVRAGALVMRVALEEGEQHDLVLEIAGDEELGEPADPAELWTATSRAWKHATAEVTGPRAVREAFAVLHGMTGPSGGTVAAATTSLPERADRGRSYDYRYVWIRDLCYIGSAAASAGARSFVTPALRFLTARLLADGAALQPAYTVDGAPVPAEHRLGVAGYPGGADVVGNRVRTQFQLDPFGEALRFLALADELEVLDEEGWRAAQTAVDAIADRWQEPDAGIWELEPHRWTHSRLICVAGLRAIAKCARADGQKGRWMTLADEILAAADATCRPDGAWTRAPGDDRIDAALLLGGIRGATTVDDPRHRATVAAVIDELSEDGYVFRFRSDPTKPLGEAEGSFMLCNLWMSLAALAAGDRPAAVQWYERALATAGPSGLLAEEFDVRERHPRGNLPQAFVHGLVIEVASALGPR